MKTRTRNGTNALNKDIGRVRGKTEGVVRAAEAIRRTAEEVALGVDEQVASLDNALSSTNEVVASLKETAGQAEYGGRIHRTAHLRHQ